MIKCIQIFAEKLHKPIDLQTKSVGTSNTNATALAEITQAYKWIPLGLKTIFHFVQAGVH